MWKEMISEGSKTSSKRVSLLIFTMILIVSYFSEQWFGAEMSDTKFNSLIGLVEITLMAVLGDKLPAMIGAFKGSDKKDESTPG